MELLKEKVIKAYCLSCGVKQSFIYISLENIINDLVYWECNCGSCGETKDGFSNIGFDNI